MKLFARSLVSIALLGGSLVFLPRIRAQDSAGNLGTKENLDLPFDASGKPDEDDDAPEIVTFYAQPVEGDGIFYCVDRSSSMGDCGELEVAKRELARNIAEFSDRVEFGIVFFDAGILKFPSSGQPATAKADMKPSALSFVQSVTPGNGSCVQQGLTQCLRIANISTAQRKVMIYLGDGRGHCQGADEETYLRQAISTVTAQNYQRIPIHCILVLDRTDRGEAFLRQLAANNGGTYSVKGTP